MTDLEKAKCDEWLRAHAKHWQTYRRGDWHYVWKGKTLVRYLDNVSMRELQDGLVLEYLCSEDCVATLSLYSQGVAPEWTPVNAWYESMPMRPSNTGMAQVRLYHALKMDVESGGDGPYSVEDGCIWKVSWKYFWKQTEVADLPESSSGVNYQIRNLTRDDEDGTFSYMLECRERVQQDVDEYLQETDEFHAKYHEEHLGVKADDIENTGLAASYGEGEKVVRTIRKNEDCTSDVLNDRIVDNKVESAVTETRSTLRGTSVTTVNRGMPDPASEDSVPVGCSVRNEKTDTGLWTQTIVTRTAGDIGTIREECSKTLFGHEHSDTDVEDSNPGFDDILPYEAKDTESGEGEVASPGEKIERSVGRNDDGTFDVVTKKRKDYSVSGAEVSVRKTLSGTVKTTTDRNQPSPPSTENLKIGDQVSYRRTDTNLYDTTKSSIDTSDVGEISTDCLKTAHEHRDVNTSVESKKPERSAASDVANGTISERSVQVTDVGGYRITDTKRVAVQAAAEAVGGTKLRTVTTTTYRNGAEQDLGAPEAVANEEVDVTSHRNEFGLYDGTVRVVSHSEAVAVSSGGSPLATESTVVSDFTELNPAMTPTKGVIYGTSASPNELGTFRTSVTKRIANKKILPSENAAEGDFQEVRWKDVRTSRTSRVFYQNRIIIFRNCEQAPAIKKENENEGVSVDVHINEFGLLDGRYIFTLYLGEEYITPGGGGAGEQGDENRRVTRSRNVQFVYKGSDGKKYVVKQVYSQDFTIRYLWSSKENMLRETIDGSDYPEYGLYSRIHGWYAVIVKAASSEKLTSTVKEPLEK